MSNAINHQTIIANAKNQKGAYRMDSFRHGYVLYYFDYNNDLALVSDMEGDRVMSIVDANSHYNKSRNYEGVSVTKI